MLVLIAMQLHMHSSPQAIEDFSEASDSVFHLLYGALSIDRLLSPNRFAPLALESVFGLLMDGHEPSQVWEQHSASLRSESPLISWWRCEAWDLDACDTAAEGEELSACARVRSSLSSSRGSDLLTLTQKV